MAIKYIKAKDQKDLASIVSAKFINIVKTKPMAKFILATGSSPIKTYEAIIHDHKLHKTDWSRVTTFNLDEYVGLSPNSAKSYRHFMDETLFDKINIKKENTFVPEGLGNAAQNAVKYEKMIFSYAPFDLTILGVGSNGHIAFNEPGSKFDGRTDVVALTPETIAANKRFFTLEIDVPRTAISMGIGTILEASKEIVLIAFGKNKTDAIKAIKLGKVDPNWPITSLLNHRDVTIVYTDLEDDI